MSTENEREKAQAERPTAPEPDGELELLVAYVVHLGPGTFTTRGLRPATAEDLEALGHKTRSNQP